MVFVIIFIIFFVIAFPVLWWIGTGNDFRRYQIKIEEALSGTEVALTKRYDMLTKLMDVAKGYAAHEKDLFAQVIELRRGMSVNEMNEKAAQIDALSSQIHAVAENYPELRSAEVFKELQVGIRDAEEHLQASRRLYNSNVSIYNQSLKVFPNKIVAKKMNLQPKEFFVAEEQKRGDVKISF